jgi:ADP-ribosylglycohydrolase
VGSVIDTVLGELSSVPRKEIEDCMAWAREHKDWKQLRAQFQDKYTGRHFSNAVEVLGSALSLFWLADGDTRQSLIWAVNFGRDCDCRAYVASSLAAALNGGASLDQKWIDTIEAQLPTDPYTVSTRSLKDTADGLYAATMNTLEERRRQVREIEALL